ncbi:MAG: hypothetical protein ACTSUE_21315 [Promethearchaeota archaeon]
MKKFLGDKISQLIPNGHFQPPIQHYESVLNETEVHALSLVNQDYITANSGKRIYVFRPNRQDHQSVEAIEPKNQLEINFNMASQRISANYKYIIQKELIQGLFEEGTINEQNLQDSPWPNGFGFYSAYSHASRHFEASFLLIAHSSYKGQKPPHRFKCLHLTPFYPSIPIYQVLF